MQLQSLFQGNVKSWPHYVPIQVVRQANKELCWECPDNAYTFIAAEFLADSP